MKPAARKLILTIHIGASVAWIGAVLSYLALDIVTARGGDVTTLKTAYVAMAIVARWIIIPLAFAAWTTGVLIAVTTSWGLFRHYWVVISLILTTIALVVLLVEMRTIDALASVAADATTTEEELRALPSTLPHSIGGLLVLTVVLALNIYKPRGLTRYGWRKQGERRP